MEYDKSFPKNYNPQGKVETYSFYSSVLGNTRNLYIYTPHDYSHTSSPQDLLIAFDGNAFIQNLSAPITLDHFIHKQEIPSCIVVGIDQIDRLHELTYNDNMNAFLIEELQANRSLYKTLREKEYQITYSEFQGGHDEIWWREQFAEGILALNHSRALF